MYLQWGFIPVCDVSVAVYKGYPYGKLYRWGRKYGKGYEDGSYEDATYPSGGGILSGARILFGENLVLGGRESCLEGGEDLVTGCREGVTDDKPNSMPNLLEQLLRCEEGKARRRKGAKKGKVRRRER